jgi:Pectate lyase superfamily protein
MAFELFANDGQATVTAGGTTAPSAGTVESWTLSGSTLPAASSSANPPTQFYACDALSSAESEKVLITNISGSTATVTRGADGTTPVAHTTPFTIQNVVTRASLGVFQRRVSWWNVLDFGADPTGSSDSTTAIQEALNAASAAGGGDAYAPAGSYLVTPPSATVPALVIPSNVTLRGDGIGASTLVKNGNGHLLDFSGPGPVSQDTNYSVWQGLRELAINGNSKTGLLLRLYYLQFYYESDVYLYGNADVSVDMVQCWDSRIDNGLYLGGGSASASAISGGQACTHLIRNSAAPATTLSAGISGTITSLPVAALPEAMPAGIVQVWNASGQLQNFTTTGATSGATSIPVTSVAVAHTFVSGDFVNGFGWSGDSTNATWFTRCHWEAGLSGAIWITPGVGSTANTGEIKITNSKVEEDQIGYDCPIIQVDPGCLDIRISQLYQYAGGYNSGYSTPVTMLYFHPDSGSLDHIWQSNGGTACVSTGIDAGTTSGWHLTLSDVNQYWGSSPTVAGFNGNGGTPWLLDFQINGTVTTPMTGTYALINGNAGTVTGTSVVSANGFAGTVANSTTTPAITLTTTVSAGMVKSTGSAFSAATAGTDYQAPLTSGSPLAISAGGTGATSAASAFNALSPMTTLGDMTYGGTSGAGTRVAGNTTTTKKFWTQTGTGSASAAPGWNALVSGDIPNNAANTTGTAANLTGGATFPAYVAPEVSSLTASGGTVAVNAALANAFNYTVAASTTISNPTNAVDGQVIRFRVTSGGSFTTSWGTAYDFGTGSAPTLSTTSGKVDIIAFEYVASISKWCYLGSGLGY